MIARNALTAILWLPAILLWPLWLLFSESCDWVDRRGQRRFAQPYHTKNMTADGGGK